jgi:Ca-activated chloride channel family protein
MLELEGSLDVPVIAARTATELRCQLVVRAGSDVVPASKPLVANVCLVFDCSGSMYGEKVDAAIDAAKRIVDTIDERHRISLVGFAASTRVIVDNAQASAAGRDDLKARIDRLRHVVGGGTQLGGGIRSGADLVHRFGADARVLVVLTDGASDDPQAAIDQAQRAAELGIQVFAVGIGDDYQADHLLKLVTPSSGSVFAPDHLEGLATIFGDFVARIESFVATNALLTVTLGEGVRPRRLFKTRPQQAYIGDLSVAAPREIEIRVGHVERGQTIAYLIALLAPATATPTLDIARATLTFDVPALGLHAQTRQLALGVTCGKEAREPDAEISGAYRRAQIARLVEELADAQRRQAKEECLDRVDLLIRLCDEQGDERMKRSYEQLREGIARDRAIAQKTLNEVVIASTERKAEASGAIKQLYDVVLVAAGDNPILLLRALREVTARPLRELNDLIAMTPSAVCEALPIDAAKAMATQIDAVGTGARVEVRRR